MNSVLCSCTAVSLGLVAHNAGNIHRSVIVYNAKRERERERERVECARNMTFDRRREYLAQRGSCISDYGPIMADIVMLMRG